jgi:hypothetical protein
MRYVEDIVKDEKIDIVELRKAKKKHPISHWFRMQYLKIRDFICFFE